MLLHKITRISTTQLATWEHTNVATQGTYFLKKKEKRRDLRVRTPQTYFYRRIS
jgi:hypothetical protein